MASETVGSDSTPFGTIMVAYDDTPLSRKALTAAGQLRHAHARLIVLIVVELHSENAALRSSAETEKMNEATRNEAVTRRFQAKKVAEMCKIDNAEYVFKESTDVKQCIKAAVEEFKVDVLCVGSRGLNAIQRLVLGSVSNYCLHELPCTVLISR
eukprot:TRINITY_DN2192_c0_g1_i5.p1 TRINITY_DN2192_c0_g1~~TRINITY_DN2192_c0_g1_i5.p1  ORF type:complete len:162 (-),score=34.22 TRINITY_DN2192_c0_g1_i5:156-620(-)